MIFVLGNLVFAFPNQISAGGVTGLSTLLYYKLDWNVGVVYFLLNMPLFIIAWQVSRQLFFQSLGSMILCSILIGLLEPLSPIIGIQMMWVGSLVGGLVMGIGLGLMGMANASLGGGSLAGKMMAIRFGLPFSASTFVIDASVYPFFFLLLGAEQTLFSLLLTLCSSAGIYLVERIGMRAKFKYNKIHISR